MHARTAISVIEHVLARTHVSPVEIPDARETPCGWVQTDRVVDVAHTRRLVKRFADAFLQTKCVPAGGLPLPSETEAAVMATHMAKFDCRWTATHVFRWWCVMMDVVDELATLQTHGRAP